MATARELEIITRQAQSSLPGGGPSRANTMLLRNQLQKIQQDSAAARKRVANTLSSSAQKQADVMRMAAGVQQSQAIQNSSAYKQALAESQLRTEEATKAAQGYLNPWREAGVDALGKLQEKIAAGPGEFEESPGYQFRQDEAQKAVERSAAARGGVLSGRAIKEAQRHSQNLATEDYDNFLRRYYESLSPLERMSAQGMDAASRVGTIGMTGAKQMADESFRSTSAIADEGRYGAEAYAQGQISAADIIAKQQEAQAERDYGYAAWKAGEDF